MRVMANGLSSAWLVTQIRPPKLSATFVVKGTYPFGRDRVLEPESASGDVCDSEGRLRYPSDFVPWKPRADLLLVGAAPDVFQVGHHRMVRKPFGPVPPERRSQTGTYDERWLQHRWPWYPEDFEWSYFNAAPAHQQYPGYLRGDEEIILESPTRLPGVQPSCFVDDREVPLNLDTLWVDMDAQKFVLVWRGILEVQTLGLSEIEQISVFAEPGESPREVPTEELPPPGEEFTIDEVVKAMESDLDRGEAEVAKTEEEYRVRLLAMGIDVPAAPPLPEEPCEENLVETPEFSKWTRESILGAVSLEGQDLSGLDLSGLELRGARFAGANLSMTDFSGSDLRGADFRRCQGRGCSFVEANLSGAHFSQAQLPACVFTRARLEKTDFSDAALPASDFEGAIATGLKAERADLTGLRAGEWADFTGANFRGALASSSTWERGHLEEADFSDATLTRANFSAASLKKAKFHRAELTRAVFDDSCLLDADLRQANVCRGSFERAELSRADLRGANCYAAEFWDARLSGANLAGTNVDATKLAGAV